MDDTEELKQDSKERLFEKGIGYTHKANRINAKITAAVLRILEDFEDEVDLRDLHHVTLMATHETLLKHSLEVSFKKVRR
ncbi:MAG: hypothetical protein GWN40_13045 [Nitrosopumilaceae archaeon]|nr:hypothetical protein [Nitrosopumilaceae archaeon]